MVLHLCNWCPWYLNFIKRSYLVYVSVPYLLKYGSKWWCSVLLSCLSFTAGLCTKVWKWCIECVAWFVVEIMQNKPSQKLQQTTQKQNLEQTMPQLFAARYSRGVKMGWPNFVQGMFAAAVAIFLFNGGSSGTLSRLYIAGRIISEVFKGSINIAFLRTLTPSVGLVLLL